MHVHLQTCLRHSWSLSLHSVVMSGCFHVLFWHCPIGIFFQQPQKKKAIKMEPCGDAHSNPWPRQGFLCVAQPNGWVTTSLWASIRPILPYGGIWTKGLDAAQASGRGYFLPILQTVGSQEPEPCALTHKHHRHTGTLQHNTWGWQLLHRQHLLCFREGGGRSVPTTRKGSAYFFFPWVQSNIVPMSLGFSHSKGRAQILLVGDLPPPLPTCIWRMIGGGSLCTSSWVSAGQWSRCEILWVVFFPPSVPSDLCNSE